MAAFDDTARAARRRLWITGLLAVLCAAALTLPSAASARADDASAEAAPSVTATAATATAQATAKARAKAKAKAKKKAKARAKKKKAKAKAKKGKARAKKKRKKKKRAKQKAAAPPTSMAPAPVAPVAQPASVPPPSPAAPAPPAADPGPPTRPDPRQPTPPAHRDGSAGGWNGYGAGSWPGANWRPYAASSPFNRTVGGAAVHPNSAALVRKILAWGSPANMVAGTSGTASDYGHPTYWSQPTDPLFTLRATGTPNGIQGTQIRIPDAAQPARGGDSHMTVVTPEGWEYDFWQVTSKPRGGGTLTFSIGGRIPIDGDGLDGKATASLFGNLAGIIRAQEMAAGEIDHALFVVLKCSSASTGFGYGTQPGPSSQSAYVYPATHGAARCSGSEEAEAPPLGARLQLTMSDAQIAALAVPPWKKTILRALAHYGGYFGDTGGSGFGLMFESGATYTSFGVQDQLVDFAAASGLPARNGQYVFDVASGVDWAQYLRVLVPPAP